MIDIVTASDCMESMCSTKELLTAYHSFLSDISDVYFALGRFDRFNKRDNEIISVNYPEEWVSRYTDRKYIFEDPTISQSAQTQIPYLWHEFRDLRPSQRAIFSDLSDFGVQAGYTIPLHAPDGMTFVASFAFRRPVIPAVDRVAITALTSQFYFRYKRLLSSSSSQNVLSERERECLCWAARGKSSWETGMILGITENTVNFHIKNALGKLQSNNRIEGVVRAICLGLISP
ncbi:autoinducer binding domain-containing protein [Gluconacetobacter sp.]|uniref:autoinducer binding domain-containing protein n=1 Tax=Gluconacetobacter sp. TaxID=1935994 RepID=UPI0039EB9ACA